QGQAVKDAAIKTTEVVGTLREETTRMVVGIDDETRFYTETFVSDYGEEGPPGPASLEVTLRTSGNCGTTGAGSGAIAECQY
ncbi:hypothetical protein S91_00358, partial [Escherichia coli O104:H4 str. Ec12-0466]